MYLPRNLPLCRPHVSMWAGESGKHYDFAVARPGTIGIDEPAVFILAKHEEGRTIPLHIGQTSSLHAMFGLSGDSCPEEWRLALAMGMTHVHVRFDACSEDVRQAEVRDLVAALKPPIKDGSAKPAANVTPSRAVPRVAVIRAKSRDRWKPDLGEVMAQSSASVPGQTRANAFAEPPHRTWCFRADPAREDDDDLPSFGAASYSASEAYRIPDRIPVASERRLADADNELTPIEPDGLIQPVPQHGAEPSANDAHLSKGALPWSSAGLFGLLRRLRDLIATSRANLTATAARAPWPVQSRCALQALPADDMEEGAVVVDRQDAVVFGPITVPNTEVTISASESAVTEVAPLKSGACEVATPEIVALDGAASEVATSEIVPPSIAISEDVALEVVPLESAASEVVTPEIAAPEVIAPEAAAPEAVASHQAHDARRSLDLQPTAPVGLFAGSLSYEAGADILTDAVITVCGADQEAMFLFAGEGVLRGEMQAQVARAGLDRRCRFLGDVPAGEFGKVLAACDFVIIPARVGQGDGLARMAIANGKPVLTTHQSGLQLIVHGQNGLVTYDNPGSLVWGIRELLSPLYADLRRHLAKAA